MKQACKAILFLTLISGITDVIYAQSKKPKFGLKYGFNISQMNGENYYSKSLGYEFRHPLSEIYGHLGMFVEIPLGDHFAIQPEALFTITGYDWYTPTQWNGYINPMGLGGVKSDPDKYERLSLVSIPLLLKLRLGKWGIFGAPQMDILISAKRKTIAGLDPKEDVKNDYEKTSFSFSTGLEYTFKFGLGINARYQFGISNIANSSTTGIYEEGNTVKNNMVMFGPYFKFGNNPRKRKKR